MRVLLDEGRDARDHVPVAHEARQVDVRDERERRMRCALAAGEHDAAGKAEGSGFMPCSMSW